MNTHASGKFVRFRSTGILRLSVRMRHKGRGTGRGGGSRVDRSRMTNEKKKGKIRVKGERALSHGSSSPARPNKQSLSSLWSPAYLRPATNSQQVPRLFLAFLRKEILCVPAYVLTMEEKFHERDERKREKARRNAENLNKSRAAS